MAEKPILEIKMLGGFSLRFGDAIIDDQNDRSKKLWTLLEYLITFRDRQISQNELIELLWPEEDNENPANALKTLLHRVRNMLDRLGYLPAKDMIITRRGAYGWNAQMECVVDADQFETLCAKGIEEGQNPEAQLAYFQQALSLYKGDFLPKSSLDSWVVPISTYYHSMYLRVVHETIGLLMEKNQYEEIVHLCQEAVGIDPYDEKLHYHLILALVKMGNTQAAMSQYDHVTDLFYSQFGVTPSEDITTLYREVVKGNQNMEIDLNVIKSHLKEADAIPGAFFCEYEFFKDIYRLESRAAARTGQSIFICLLTLSDGQGTLPPQKMLNNTMAKLKDCIRLSLRRGDVYARYSVSQYIIMLPTLTYENGEMVMKRIVSRFRHENPRSTVSLSYKLQPLDPA